MGQCGRSSKESWAMSGDIAYALKRTRNRETLACHRCHISSRRCGLMHARAMSRLALVAFCVSVSVTGCGRYEGPANQSDEPGSLSIIGAIVALLIYNRIAASRSGSRTV